MELMQQVQLAQLIAAQQKRMHLHSLVVKVLVVVMKVHQNQLQQMQVNQQKVQLGPAQ